MVEQYVAHSKQLEAMDVSMEDWIESDEDTRRMKLDHAVRIQRMTMEEQRGAHRK